jgi:hypothetical protein
MNKHTLYALKRRYGVNAVYYRIIDKSLNLETGQQVITTEVTKIKRAIFLPTNVERRTLSKSTYYFDPDKREVIIDEVDFKIRVGDYLIYNCCKYNIIEVNDYELDGAYLLIVQSDSRAKWLLAEDRLIITDEATL